MERTFRTIEGEDGSPYLTQAILGRLRLHVFHRGDADPDPHDHPWGFWTFPLVSYVEEVTVVRPDGSYTAYDRVVRSLWPHYRPATHLHRVLGRARPGAWTGLIHLGEPVRLHRPGKVVTLVWRDAGERPWGFLKTRDGRSCWQAWRDYILGGGKHAPCEPADAEGAPEDARPPASAITA